MDILHGRKAELYRVGNRTELTLTSYKLITLQ